MADTSHHWVYVESSVTSVLGSPMGWGRNDPYSKVALVLKTKNDASWKLGKYMILIAMHIRQIHCWQQVQCSVWSISVQLRSFPICLIFHCHYIGNLWVLPLLQPPSLIAPMKHGLKKADVLFMGSNLIFSTSHRAAANRRWQGGESSVTRQRNYLVTTWICFKLLTLSWAYLSQFGGHWAINIFIMFLRTVY